MNERDLLVAAYAFCGLLTFCGAFFLLYLGIIKLEPPDKNASPTEFMVNKIFKIKTNIGALALFVIGLAALWLGSENIAPKVATLTLTGRVLNVHPHEIASVSVCGGPWPVAVLADGSFNFTITPDLNQFQVEVGKVGVPTEKTLGLRKKGSPEGLSSVFIIQNDAVNLGPIPLEALAPSAPGFVDEVTNAPAPKVNYAASH